MKVISGDVSKIESYIEGIRRIPDINEFFCNLQLNCHIYFIGGFIRSLYNNKPIRDIDIIYQPKFSSFSINSINCNINLNILRGQKIEIGGMTFDLWCIFDNWAFKNDLYIPTFQNIQYGTYYNFDSLVYGFDEKRLLCSIYNNSVTTNTLDFVNHNQKYIYSNPRPELNIVKACIYHYYYQLNLSDNILLYIKEWSKKIGDVNILLDEELRHFNKRLLSKYSYQNIVKIALNF